MKIHRRIVATEVECTWKPCCECGRAFELHEILTAVDIGGNGPILHWLCEECMERLFGHLLRRGWRGTWRIRKADGSREAVDWNRAG